MDSWYVLPSFIPYLLFIVHRYHSQDANVSSAGNTLLSSPSNEDTDTSYAMTSSQPSKASRDKRPCSLPLDRKYDTSDLEQNVFGSMDLSEDDFINWIRESVSFICFMLIVICTCSFTLGRWGARFCEDRLSWTRRTWTWETKTGSSLRDIRIRAPWPARRRSYETTLGRRGPIPKNTSLPRM